MTDTVSLSAIPRGVVVETETEYYTDWRCAKCHEWRDRTYPARVVTSSRETLVFCREHDSGDDDDECGCHCHEAFICNECGEPS